MRPPQQGWASAVWLEPQRRSWRVDLERIKTELPQGGQLSIVLSLPLAWLQRGSSLRALGLLPGGVQQLRAALIERDFSVERAFGFQTAWSIALGGLATRMRPHRPDWSDRLRYAARRYFTTRGFGLRLAVTGLIEARAGSYV